MYGTTIRASTGSVRDVTRSSGSRGLCALALLSVTPFSGCAGSGGATLEVSADKPVVVVVAPGYRESDVSDFTEMFVDEKVDVVVAPLADVIPNSTGVTDLVTEAADGAPCALIAFGHNATPAWDALPQLSQVLRSATLISVPAVPNLEAHEMRGLPVLDLHSQLDRATVRAHQRVHDALSVVGIPHEMVVYGNVGSAFFARSSAEYDAATTSDAAARAHEWVMTSIRTEDLLDVRE